MGAFTQNIRYGLRMLGKNPSFTMAAVLCLALGIGATTAIFSVVNAVLLRQLPYANSDRLVRVFTEFPNFPNGGLRHFWMSPPEFLELRREVKAWEQLEAWVNGGVSLAGASDAVRASASFVTGGMMPMLGVKPKMGRVLTVEDDEPSAAVVAVLSEALWRTSYGSDPAILGRDIRLNGQPCRVVGVMPASFDFPPGEAEKIALWSPIQLNPAKPGSRSSHFLNVLGKVRRSTSMAAANEDIQRIVRQFGANATQMFHTFQPANHPLTIVGFQDHVVKNVRLAMFVLLGAVVFVLLIASVNVANLLLARAESRRREIAIRKAIGASLPRLIGQFIVEGIVLSLLGAMLGLGVAYAGLRLIVSTNPGSLPRAAEIGIDVPVLLFTVSVSLLTGVLFGLAPLMHIVGQNLHETLKAAAGRTTGNRGTHHFRQALVVAELSLALMLLIGAGLMVKAFWRLQNVNAGFKPDRVITALVNLPSASYTTLDSRRAFWTMAQSRIAALPGVESSSIVTGLPPMRPINANDTEIEGFVVREGGPQNNIDYWNTTGLKYFETLGVRLVDGRLLDERDGAGAPPAVVVNQTMARMYWGNQSPVGRRVRPGFQDPWRTVVGVVEDVKNAGLDRPAGTELYFPIAQAQVGNGAYVLVRGNRPEGLITGVRQQIHELDPSAPVSQVRMMEEVLSAARARPRFLSILLTLFSGVALALAAVGIYGVLSYSVAQRTSEIGIRMALGARGGDVLRLVIREGLITGFVGTAIGAAGAVALTRVLQGLLFGVSSFDPITFAAMSGVLVLVVLAACYVPARRASGVDPMVALRYE